MHQDPALALLPEPLRERFQVTRLLGRGGMGAVFEGRLPGTGRPCAVKIVYGNPGSSAGARLIQEARLLSRVRHPHLVEVYDVGEEKGMPWVVMELVEGQDLEGLHGDRPMTLDELERVARDVTDVLEVLHGQGILHRDIKPQNLMRDASGRTIVMDLGLARDVEATRQTATGALVGTLLFLPPEALTHDQQGPAWDWYALGMSLYVLLTGEKPYTGEQIFAMAAQGRWRPPPPLPPPAQGTPLGRTCEALLHPDPALRLHDAAAVRAALEGRDPSGVVRRPSYSVALAAPAPPRPGRGRALAVGAALFGFGLGLGGWWMRRGPASSPPASEAAPATEAAPEAPASPLAALAEAMIPGGGATPLRTLEALVRAKDRDRAARVVARLDEARDPAVHDFVLFRYLETEGDHDALRDLFSTVAIPGPLESYLQARLAVEAVGHRLVVEGPYAPDATPEDHARLKRDLAGLDAALAARPETWAGWARVELWDVLSRRAQVRPRLNLPALQIARELADELRASLPKLEGLQGCSALQAYSRQMARLGEVDHGKALLDAFEAGLLAPVRAEEVRAFWHEEFLWEFRGHELPAGGGLFSADRLFQPSFAVDWLPEVPGRRGLGPPGQAIDPAVVRGPPPGPEVPVSDAGAAPEALEDARRRALVAGGTVRTDMAWRQRHLTPEALRSDDELRRQVTRSPEVLASLVPSMEEAGEHELLLSLYREVDRRRRNSTGYLWENRAHFTGATSEAVRRLIDLELRFGDLGKGMDRASTELEHFRKLNPAYTLEELFHASEVWRLLEGKLNRNGYCPDFRDEYLRVALHYLEALVALRPGRQAPAAERDAWVLRVTEVAGQWTYYYARDMAAVDGDAWRALVRQAGERVATLGEEAALMWEQQRITLMGERTRRALAGDHGCPDRWVEGVRSPPEAVFGAPEGGKLERYLAALARL